MVVGRRRRWRRRRRRLSQFSWALQCIVLRILFPRVRWWLICTILLFRKVNWILFITVARRSIGCCCCCWAIAATILPWIQFKTIELSQTFLIYFLALPNLRPLLCCLGVVVRCQSQSIGRSRRKLMLKGGGRGTRQKGSKCGRSLLSGFLGSGPIHLDGDHSWAVGNCLHKAYHTQHSSRARVAQLTTNSKLVQLLRAHEIDTIDA